MKLPDTMNDEQQTALVEVCLIFAARGRAIREQREREQAENENRANAGAGRDSQDGLTSPQICEVFVYG